MGFLLFPDLTYFLTNADNSTRNAVLAVVHGFLSHEFQMVVREGFGSALDILALI